jgi:hypothetical protein
MTHTRKMESAAKSVLWEGCLTVLNSERKTGRTAQQILARGCIGKVGRKNHQLNSAFKGLST